MKESKISLINLQEQGKSMSNYTRMFRGKMRMSTCRIILITSLAWLLIDVIIIMRYTDGLSGGIFKKSQQKEVSELESVKLFLCRVGKWKHEKRRVFRKKCIIALALEQLKTKRFELIAPLVLCELWNFVVFSNTRNKSENRWLSRCRLR